MVGIDATNLLSIWMELKLELVQNHYISHIYRCLFYFDFSVTHLHEKTKETFDILYSITLRLAGDDVSVKYELCSIQFLDHVIIFFFSLFSKPLFQNEQLTQSKIKRTDRGNVPSHCDECEVSMPSLFELVRSHPNSAFRRSHGMNIIFGLKSNRMRQLCPETFEARLIQWSGLFMRDSVQVEYASLRYAR